MKKFIFVWALVLILLSPLSVSSQTVPQDTSQVAEDILRHEGQIDTLRMEFEKVKKQAYNEAIEAANRTISVAGLFIGIVAILAGFVTIFGLWKLREQKADYTEFKAELRKSFEHELERIKEYKQEVKAICDEIKEKGRFAERKVEEIEILKKNIEAQEKEVPSDFSKEVSELIKKGSKTAIEDYEKVMNKVFDEDIYFTMAYNYHVEKKYDESIGELKKVVTLNPKRYGAYLNWGVALGELGRHEEEIEKYRKAIELKPNCAEAYNNWGLALGEVGRHEEAIEKYRKAIELKPDYADAYVNWGAGLARLGRYDQAIEKYTKAIELKPDDADVYSNWCQALTQLGRHDEAIEKGKKAIALKPDYASAWYNLGCVYSLQNNKVKALENLKRAIELDLKYKEKAKKDEDFMNLWEDEDFKKLVE